MPQRMPNGSEWPRISIITPNYNYARYLETTIRSVLLQGYPNLEYIIQDDGSTDGSIDLIRRYERHLAYWSTEANSGAPSVINRGMRRSTGSILAYIGSDDYYLPSAFAAVALHFHEHPEADLVYGRCWIVDERGQKIREQFARLSRLDEVLDLWNVWFTERHIVQPESFWRRRIYTTVGNFRTDLSIAFDYEYWCRMLMAGAVFQAMDKDVACYRRQPSQLTSTPSRTAAELLAVINRLLWDKNVPLIAKRRRELQAEWFYHTVFLPAIEQSIGCRESRLRRWVRLAAISARYPRIIRSQGFRRRWNTVFGNGSLTCQSNRSSPST
jgi:glycosyltransferase involved in cell wall biosynthesis